MNSPVALKAHIITLRNQFAQALYYDSSLLHLITGRNNCCMATWQDRARDVMKRKKISQDSLAEMLGIAQPTVSAKLRGTRETTIDELTGFAAALDVKPEWLAFESGDEHRNDDEHDLVAGFRVASPETRDSMMYQARKALEAAASPLPKSNAA